MDSDRSHGASEHDHDPQARPDVAERLRVARVGRPHGVRGEVTVQLFTDEPQQRLCPGALLHRTPGLRTVDRETAVLTVSTQRWNKHICLLGFSEITDRGAAEALRGSVLHVQVPTDAEDSDDGWYSHQILGFRCLDPHGHQLGTARELLNGPAQDLLVVDTPDGSEVLVPFVDELIPVIDAQERLIHLDPPEGLF